jgi:phage-related protein
VPVTVPIDLDVTGGGLAEAVEKDLKKAEAVAGHAGADAGDAFGDGFSREVSKSAKEVDALLTEATRTRNADIDIDIDGMGELATLRESLDLTKQRAEVAALERALNDVAELRRAGVNVEVDGVKELAALDRALKAVERRHVAKVEVEVEGDGFETLVRSATRNSGAVHEAFSGAFQLIAKNAVLLVGAVALAFAAFPVIGAAAAAGLVLGFGGIIAGVGILAAAQSERVKTAFSEMADHIVTEMKQIAAPLEGTLVSVADDITSAFDNMAPTFEDAFEQIAQSLTGFSDQFFDAFQNLTPAVQPLTDAFTDLLDSIGPRLDGFFTDISDSVTNLSDVIASDPELFASLFVGLLGILPLVINLIADLARTFQIISDLVGTVLAPAISDLRAAFEPLTSLFGDSVSGLNLFRIGLMSTITFVGAVVIAITAVVRTVTMMVGLFRAAGGAIAATWRNTLAVTSSVWGRIRGVISSAIAAVRGAVSRGLSSVRATFSSVWASARAIVAGAMASVRATVTGAIARVRGIVASGLGAVRAAFSSGLAAARAVVSSAMSSIRSAVSSGIGRVVSLVAGLPGRIRGALGGLGSMLFSSGLSMISGLADGIRAGIGNAVSAAQSAVSAVRNFFPFSPAKEGPFSGSGYTTYSGEALMKDFAKSMEDTANAVAPQVAASLDPFASAIPSVSGRPASSSTSTTTVNNGVDVSSLAALMGRIALNVTLGRDRRTTAEWWLDGQRLAGELS